MLNAKVGHTISHRDYGKITEKASDIMSEAQPNAHTFSNDRFGVNKQASFLCYLSFSISNLPGTVHKSNSASIKTGSAAGPSLVTR